MEPLDQIANTISLTMGVAWASGINLYAAILVLGLLGTTGNIALPATLQILKDPMVIINTSPEPFTNWGASIAEDVAVIGGLLQKMLL
jgi:hypothetical protein